MNILNIFVFAIILILLSFNINSAETCLITPGLFKKKKKFKK
jgi:hypothetical protein